GRGGDFTARPGAAEGAEAARTAGRDVPQGNVGAGTGALNAALKGGLGTASVSLGGGIVVGAVAALNAVGPSVDPTTGLPFAHALGLPGEFPAPGGDDPAAVTRTAGAVQHSDQWWPQRPAPHPYALASAAQDTWRWQCGPRTA
ncbi:P1 family peptidase, partial [Saccharothrix sp. MB29]|nr:P1 family peptidase [Saccharothrix sp. MB29]